ncbi:MAG: acetolactate decarboxylase [Planctomycetes bacterium]|nr:acetolactate decarboxylase [Planctomycetota bacterium]
MAAISAGFTARGWSCITATNRRAMTTSATIADPTPRQRADSRRRRQPTERGRSGSGSRGWPLLLLLTACANHHPDRVEHFGVMREVMRDGKTGPRVDLARFEQPGWYAVGALAGLQGEILIDDGRVLVARQDAQRITEVASNAHATLLTAARVSAWREMPLPDGGDLASLERSIDAAVGSTPEPVPFRILGACDVLEMHVVRGACPHGTVDPEREPFRYRQLPGANPSVVTIVGFFAPGREGELTHHGTAIHAHALVTGPFAARQLGHIDELTLRPGARLFVPAEAP